MKLAQLDKMNLMIALAALAFSACGQAADDSSSVTAGPPTWEQFLATAYQEADTGVYIVDGDTPVTNEKQLREFYDELLVDYYKAGDPLIVNRIGSGDDKWAADDKLNLTYCVSTKFGANYNKVVQAMADATQAWENAANLKFVYHNELDAACTAKTTDVLFDVNPVNANGSYLARSFFPSSPRATSNVLIDSSSFSLQAPLTLAGILRHELGHVIGLRHEHTRPESGTCFEDNNWRALTPYDSKSVMHYPQCNGQGDWSLTLTDMDKQGILSLYGPPSGSPTDPTPPTDPTNPPTPPAPPEVTTETFAGSVAKNASVKQGPFAVASGTTFEAVMIGTGDADLYVRFGSSPTTTTYTCRPYLSSSNEKCKITVPEGETKAYTMVRGYKASTYTLTVNYITASAVLAVSGQ